MTKSTGVDNCGARRAAVFPDLPTLRDNPSQPRRATRRRTASTLSRLFGPTPAMRSRARTRLPASAAATLALLLVASACVASAGATRPSLGLESMGTEACAETRAFCEGTVMDAVRADAKLVAFLTDARATPRPRPRPTPTFPSRTPIARPPRPARSSSQSSSPSDAASPPEEAAPRTSSPEPPTTTSTPPDLPPTRPPPPRRFSSWPRPTPTRRDYPPRGSSPPTPSRASPSRRVQMRSRTRPAVPPRRHRRIRHRHRSRGRNSTRALRRRSRGPLRRRRVPEVIPGEVRSKRRRDDDDDDDDDDASSSAGDPVDAADARILFKSLLAGDLDRRAAARLRELATVEEMRVASRPDEAYLAADALVRVVGRWLTRAAALLAFGARGATDDARLPFPRARHLPRGMGARGDRRGEEKVAKGSGELRRGARPRARAEGEGRARARRDESARRGNRGDVNNRE